MEKLPKNKQDAAELVAMGLMSKTDIAEHIKVSRTTLWNWENTDEFKAEVDRLKQEFKTQGQNFILGKVNATLKDIADLGKNAESEKVRLDALKYIADQALGKASSKVELSTDITDNSQVDDDLLKSAYDDFIEHNDILNEIDETESV